jgi:hypothetical protein
LCHSAAMASMSASLAGSVCIMGPLALWAIAPTGLSDKLAAKQQTGQHTP